MFETIRAAIPCRAGFPAQARPFRGRGCGGVFLSGMLSPPPPSSGSVLASQRRLAPLGVRGVVVYSYRGWLPLLLIQ